MKTLSLTIYRLILLLLLGGVLAACGTQEEADRLVDEHERASTQMSALYATSTVGAARMRTTLEYAETRVSAAATQSQLLKATLVAMGTPFEYLDAFQRQVIGDLLVQAAPLATQPAQNAGPTDIPVTLFVPPTPSPPPTPDPTQPRLEDAVTSTGVGPDDCARGVTTEFSSSDSEIYVVARAINAPPNTSFRSRWLFEGQERISHSFTPDFRIDNACIWFYIDTTETPFTVGTWSVTLEINGQPALPPVSFTIR